MQDIHPSNRNINIDHALADSATMENALYTSLYSSREGASNGLMGLRNRSRVEFMTRWIDPHRGERILDVGCNRALLLRALKNAGAIVRGVDINRSAIKEVGLNYVRYGRAEALPFRDNTFDKVIASEVLEHVRNPSRSISEIDRVLKDDGRVFITYPIEPIRGIGALADAITVHGSWRHARLLHRTRFSLRLLDSLLSKTQLSRTKDFLRFMYWPLRFVELVKSRNRF